ncbi:MAG TPA: hypothetical protein VMF61_08555 [Candidatus Acidoferrales bacterium]|nr:hypothetical protein [Candidatus Acidoferrales bacterium]
MPLQNRVTPYGEIAALAGRGLLIGNRGILCDGRRRIVRRWQSRRWIACVLSYKGIRRPIMDPHSWTELFFLDEATALAAGHRPCAECRRADYRLFRSLWERLYGSPAGADAIDRVLHAQRLAGKVKRTHRTAVRELPDGAFVRLDSGAWLVRGGDVLLWSDRGYVARRPRPLSGDAEVLTPPAIVGVLRAGYRPLLHPTAG